MQDRKNRETADAAILGMRSLLRLPAVIQATGLGRSTIYKLVAESKFPAPVRLTARAVAWRRWDVERWTSERPTVVP
jgi:prophage regulatory protein